jgi:hypothetical protein
MKDGWDDLEVIVTPDQVKAQWNGKPMVVDVAKLKRRANRLVTDDSPQQDNVLPSDLKPKMQARHEPHLAWPVSMSRRRSPFSGRWPWARDTANREIPKESNSGGIRLLTTLEAT